ncbi:unnamed protein product [Rodentolepis nana]|uniref:Uncharacterized protein n=1 Tax=Rodentolepis nana TaxID=102285 RepID=A0A0R3TMA6_RODNA|nr:unnamed protein product [Rodentolepis nana]
MEHNKLNLIELMIPEEKSNDSNINNPSVMELIRNLISGRASPPFGTREPILYHLLRSCLLAEDLVKISIVLHISILSNCYNRNLDLLQQTSKIQHIWKRRSTSKLQRRQASFTERIFAPGAGQSSNFSSVRLRRLGKRIQRRRLAHNNDSFFGQGCEDATISDSELEYTSSSEQSCTTVIYLGGSHPLRKLNAPERVKRVPLEEKKEPISKAEEKAEPAQVRSPMLLHHRRFKSRGGHKAPTGTITNELWVDGPNAITAIPLTQRAVDKTLHSSSRDRSESISEREQSSGTRGRSNTTEKGIPDGKAFNNHENFERQIESRMRKLNWSNDPQDSAKIAKQLEALITPKTDRKVRTGESFRESRQHKQTDQIQQTLNTSDFPTLPNWKYDAISAVAAGNMRGVKPFVKEWVEKQNQAIANYLVEQSVSPKHGSKPSRGATKADVHCHAANKTSETPQPSRKHRNHETKKQAEADDLLLKANDSASHSQSLPRHVPPEMLWTTQHHPVGPAPDNLSRVAQWVESVSTSEQNHHAIPKGCPKHSLQSSPLCKSCNKTSPTSNPPESPEIPVRVNSAPAARFRSHHGARAIHTIEECQKPNLNSTKAPSDPRKPDGASDPGIHRDRSFSSISGVNTNAEGPKTSPLRKPVLKRFADLFVCSPSVNRRRQHSGSHHQQPQQQPSGHVSKMCVPFFGGVSAESGTGELEAGPNEGDLTIDSVGMLFTSMSKGSETAGDESLFLEPEKIRRTASSGNQQSAEKLNEETQLGRLRIKEAGTKHRFGFLQSPLFSKRSTERYTFPTESVNPSQTTPSSKYTYPVQAANQHHQQDSIAFHCQVVLEKPPHTPHCHHKCVSQSSSSGLGSEHSEQHSLRCHCSGVQTGSRMRRCRMRTHRNRTGVIGNPEVEQEGIVSTKYTNGEHASSGYESVLRDDSELSSQSSSGGSYPWPPVGAKEAGCQTTPGDFAASALVMSQTSATIPEVLTGSFTDTVTVSQTGDTMQASTTSRSNQFFYSN